MPPLVCLGEPLLCSDPGLGACDGVAASLEGLRLEATDPALSGSSMFLREAGSAGDFLCVGSAVREGEGFSLSGAGRGRVAMAMRSPTQA